MKLNKLLGAFTALTLLGLPACDDKKDEKKTEEKADEKKADEKGEDKGEEKAEEKKEEGDGDGGGGADKIGVPECDEYVEKFTKCIEDKYPEEVRAASKEAMQQSVNAWKEAASGPAKDALAEGCKTALEAAKKGSEAYGCEW